MPYLNSTRILITSVRPNTMIATMNAHIEGLALSGRHILSAPAGSRPTSAVISLFAFSPQRLAKTGDGALAEILEAQQCFVRCLADLTDRLQACSHKHVLYTCRKSNAINRRIVR